MIRCAIADDEAIARQILEQYILETPGLLLVASCRNAFEALKAVESKRIELLFLDIEMPLVTGIQLLNEIANPPKVIFTTAYAEHAIQGYELDAVDYLLKPFSPERFRRAVKKAETLIAPQEGGHLILREREGQQKLPYRDIVYIEASGDYMKVYTNTERSYLVHMTMKKLEESLPADLFVRTHKSYIVALAQIRSLKAESLLLTGEIEIPVSGLYKEAVARWLKDG